MGAAGFAGRVNVEEYPVEEYPVAWDKIRQNLQASACILGKSHNLSGHDANAIFLSHQPGPRHGTCLDATWYMFGHGTCLVHLLRVRTVVN